jgi:hypothetical protein
MNEAVFAQLQKEMEGSVGALRKELTNCAPDALRRLSSNILSLTTTAPRPRSTNFRR